MHLLIASLHALEPREEDHIGAARLDPPAGNDGALKDINRRAIEPQGEGQLPFPKFLAGQIHVNGQETIVDLLFDKDDVSIQNPLQNGSREDGVEAAVMVRKTRRSFRRRESADQIPSGEVFEGKDGVEPDETGKSGQRQDSKDFKLAYDVGGKGPEQPHKASRGTIKTVPLPDQAQESIERQTLSGIRTCNIIRRPATLARD